MTDTGPHSTVADPIPPGGIVVGHDGSRDSDHALEVALDFAERVKAEVLIVRAWSIDTAPHGALYDHGYVSSFDQVTAIVRDALERDAAPTIARHPTVDVHYWAALAHPAQLLTEISQSALMLVVSPRGKGALAGLLLGSVSSQCVQLARCPVLVVPAPRAGVPSGR